MGKNTNLFIDVQDLYWCIEHLDIIISTIKNISQKDKQFDISKLREEYYELQEFTFDLVLDELHKLAADEEKKEEQRLKKYKEKQQP